MRKKWYVTLGLLLVAVLAIPIVALNSRAEEAPEPVLAVFDSYEAFNIARKCPDFSLEGVDFIVINYPDAIQESNSREEVDIAAQLMDFFRQEITQDASFAECKYKCHDGCNHACDTGCCDAESFFDLLEAAFINPSLGEVLFTPLDGEAMNIACQAHFDEIAFNTSVVGFFTIPTHEEIEEAFTALNAGITCYMQDCNGVLSTHRVITGRHFDNFPWPTRCFIYGNDTTNFRCFSHNVRVYLRCSQCGLNMYSGTTTERGCGGWMQEHCGNHITR